MASHDVEKYLLIKVFVSTVRHFFGGFTPPVGNVRDPRDQNRVKYPLKAMIFTGILMFLCRLGSRRQIGYQFRGNDPSQANVQALFDVETFPHGDTINAVYSRLDIDEVQECVTTMSEMLTVSPGPSPL